MAEYATEGEMVSLLGPEADTVRIGRAITTAAGVIEDVTGGRRGRRRFDLDAATSQRQFNVRDNVLTEPGGQLLLVDDIGNLDDLVIEIGDGAAWTVVTDFVPEPLNAITARGEPVTELRRVDQVNFLGARWWPDLAQTVVNPMVRIAARWGWPAVPAPVGDANRILATRYYRRKDAWAGVAGFGESGLARLQSQDPDVALMLEAYMRGGL